MERIVYVCVERAEFKQRNVKRNQQEMTFETVNCGERFSLRLIGKGRERERERISAGNWVKFLSPKNHVTEIRLENHVDLEKGEPI